MQLKRAASLPREEFLYSFAFWIPACRPTVLTRSLGKRCTVADYACGRDFLNIEHDISKTISLEMVGDNSCEQHVYRSITIALVGFCVQYDCSMFAVDYIAR